MIRVAMLCARENCATVPNVYSARESSGSRQEVVREDKS